jgi:hypothetical protein
MILKRCCERGAPTVPGMKADRGRSSRKALIKLIWLIMGKRFLFEPGIFRKENRCFLLEKGIIPRESISTPRGLRIIPRVFIIIPRVFDFNPRVFDINPRVFKIIPRVFVINPRVFEINPRVFDINPRVFDINPRVFEINPRVFKIIPRVFEINPRGNEAFFSVKNFVTVDRNFLITIYNKNN